MERSHYIAADLGFGDFGKGATVDWLSYLNQDHPPLIVRYNGGAQAGHNVWDPRKGDRWHTFSQFGATFRHAARTLLSPWMLIRPENMIREASALGWSHGETWPVFVDPDALIILPWQVAANQMKSTHHGTCGQGVGECRSDYLHESGPITVKVADIAQMTKGHLVRTLEASFEAKRTQVLSDSGVDIHAFQYQFPTPSEWADMYKWWVELVTVQPYRSVIDSWLQYSAGSVIFEGAQGVLLDELHGFHPYTTWTNTTLDNATFMINTTGLQHEKVVTLGGVRAYTTRHGAGPFPTEDAALTVALHDLRNKVNPWQGGWRVGHFDAVLHRYAAAVCALRRPIDALVITNLDRAWNAQHEGARVGICTSYDTNIPLLPLHERTVGQQEVEVTNPLFHVKPNITYYNGTEDWYTPNAIRRIEDAMEIPVALTSTGSSRHDRVVQLPELFR